uniref:Ion transport domain-containing protein n=1 Tax=Anopheles christyi TaxID=43041 RepID=A0A182KEN2_9DIPT
MDAFQLEEHLDACITNNVEEQQTGGEDHGVRINFTNIIPPRNYREVFTSNHDEMRPIVRMAQSSSTKHLFWHPVISTMLMLEWTRLIGFLYINLVLCMIFSISFAAYIVFYYTREDTPDKQWLYVFSFFGLIYLVGREVLQMFIQKLAYLCSLENVMEVLLILGYSAVLMHESTSEAWSLVLVGVLLLLGLELTLQLGVLPVNSIYTNLVILKKATKSFLECVGFFSIIILTFALGFYKLFKMGEIANRQSVPTAIQQDGDDDGYSFKHFGEIPLALVKTVVMLTGEFDASDIKFKISWPMYVLFPVFVFFVAIVINNLINGLSVSDTVTIRAESELVGIIEMVHIIGRFERALTALRLKWCILDLKLFVNENPLKTIILKPGQLRTLEYETLKTQNIVTIENGTEAMRMLKSNERRLVRREYSINTLLYKPFAGMLDKIVRNAVEILNSRRERVKSLAHRLLLVERNVERMVEDQMKFLCRTKENPPMN